VLLTAADVSVLWRAQMVPRGWWKLGLLEDLKYYKPFSTAS